MGGEDKIRVAGIAAENLAAHQTHIHTVLKTVSMVAPPAAHCVNGSDFDPTTHARRTTFPHVAPALEHVSAPSPQKRRRVGEGRPANGNGAYGSGNGRAPPKRKPPVNSHQQKAFVVLVRQPDTQIMALTASTRTVMDITMA
ncbi:hypothetical protein FRC09_016265 [Ceratobasidium sp. 395]|nr:hypothetical protein FRC09_016265 [Ceratobasidium sp. 395]